MDVYLPTKHEAIYVKFGFWDVKTERLKMSGGNKGFSSIYSINLKLAKK
jgi:hypothetical protein